MSRQFGRQLSQKSLSDFNEKTPLVPGYEGDGNDYFVNNLFWDLREMVTVY